MEMYLSMPVAIDNYSLRKYRGLMTNERRPLTDEEKAECAAFKREFKAWNAARPKSERITQEQSGNHLDMNQGSFSNYLNGHRPLHRDVALGIYELMGIPVSSYSKRLADEITRAAQAAGAGQPQGKESNVINADFSGKLERSGDISIPQFNVRGAMGSGQLPNDYVEIIRHVTMHKSHLDMLGISYTSPANLAVITGWGQSMEGTINHGEPVFVDRGVSAFTGDGVYVFTWDDLVYIKRLQKESRTHFKVISDNRDHDPFMVPINEVYVHARALLAWNAKKL